MTSLAAVCLLLLPALITGEKFQISAPVSVHFHSVNLRNVVRWTTGAGTSSGTTYTVEYTIYGQSVEVDGTEQADWTLVEQCNGIQHRECDLTEQTLDEDEEYFVRVRASRGPHIHSNWTEAERRFRPMSDTIFGPPQVKVTVVDAQMNVKLRGPFRWKNKGVKRGQSLFRIFPHMAYNISVFHNKSNHMYYFLWENDSLKLGPLEYSSGHCVMAEAHSRSLPVDSIPSEWICVTIPDDPYAAQMLVLMLGAIVPTAICLFVLAVMGGFAYYYITGHKEKLPTSTDLVHVDEDYQTFKPEKATPIINLTLNVTNLNTGESKLSCLGRLHNFAGEMDPLLPISGWPLPAVVPVSVRNVADEPPLEGEFRSSYAAQQRLLPTGSDTNSDPASDPIADHDDPDITYSCVVMEKGPHRDSSDQRIDRVSIVVEQPPVPEISVYRARSTGGEEWCQEEKNEEDKEDDEAGQTLVEWDPQTRVLKLPLLCKFGSEDLAGPRDFPEKQAETSVDMKLLQEPPILTSVMVRQLSEEEDIFAKMEKDWGLQIHSNLEE